MVNHGVLLTDVVQTSKGDLFSFRLLATNFLIASPSRNEETIWKDGRVVGVSGQFVVSAPGGGLSLVRINVIFVSGGELFYLDHGVEM